MSQLSTSLPRATELRKFYANPLDFLARARAALGDVFVLREEGPLFSRSADCAGVVAVFGPTNIEAVLTNIDAFGLPISAAEHLALPQNLINLNRGLHSMRGQQHDTQQRLLMHAFNNRSVEAMHETIRAGLEKFAQKWGYNKHISLLEEMRRLTLDLSGSLLFDQRYKESSKLAALAQNYFYTRRNATSAFNSPDETMRTELIALGASLDQAMRKYISWCRNGRGSSEGLLAKLACLQVDSNYSFSEDEAVAHGNVTFMSMNEPIAVALTWTLLLLSQMPELRRTLRERINSPLLNSVINESLRLFTPNALMSRITTRDTSLNGIPLPARCELVLCPFLAHRDAKVFSKPTEFLPSRWQSTKPSPFEYFPFGAGGHTCIGRSLGLKIITATLAFLMPHYELVLAGDQEIDWTIDIIFTPANDPIMTVLDPGISDREAGRLLGPVSELFQI
jgi:cytochrome P450